MRIPFSQEPTRNSHNTWIRFRGAFQFLRTTVRKGSNFLRYQAEIQEDQGKKILVLDFDAHAEKTKAKDYLATTDDLHVLISDAFRDTALSPLLEHMREPRE